MYSSSFSTCGLCGGTYNESGRAGNGMYVGQCNCAKLRAVQMRGKAYPPPGYERMQCAHCYRTMTRKVGGQWSACGCAVARGLREEAIKGHEVTHVWVDEAKSFSFPDAPAMPSSEPASFDSGGGGDFGGGGSSGDW